MNLNGMINEKTFRATHILTIEIISLNRKKLKLLLRNRFK